MLEHERERWRRTKELFTEAAGLAPAERGRFLDRACAGDEPMRCEVEALLAAHDEAGDTFDRGPAVASAFTGGGVALSRATGRCAPKGRLVH